MKTYSLAVVLRKPVSSVEDAETKLAALKVKLEGVQDLTIVGKINVTITDEP